MVAASQVEASAKRRIKNQNVKSKIKEVIPARRDSAILIFAFCILISLEVKVAGFILANSEIVRIMTGET